MKWAGIGLLNLSIHFYHSDVPEAQTDEEGGTVMARKVGEAVQNTLGAVATAIDIPLGKCHGAT